MKILNEAQASELAEKEDYLETYNQVERLVVLNRRIKGVDLEKITNMKHLDKYLQIGMEIQMIHKYLEFFSENIGVESCDNREEGICYHSDEICERLKEENGVCNEEEDK